MDELKATEVVQQFIRVVEGLGHPFGWQETTLDDKPAIIVGVEEGFWSEDPFYLYMADFEGRRVVNLYQFVENIDTRPAENDDDLKTFLLKHFTNPKD